MDRNGTMNENRTPPAPMTPEEAARQAYEKELAEANPWVTLDGVTYRLKYDLWALEQIEAEYGGVRQAFNAMMNGGENGGIVKTTRRLFAILANCQRNLEGKPEDVTGAEISGHMSPAKLKEVSLAIRAAVRDGNKSETADGGPASDKAANPLEKEYERKKA